MNLESTKQQKDDFPKSKEGIPIATVAKLEILSEIPRQNIYYAIREGGIKEVETLAGNFVDVNSFIEYFQNLKLGRPKKNK